RDYRPFEWSNVLVRQIDGRSLPTGGEAVRVRRIEPHEHDLWARLSHRGRVDAAPGLDEFILGLAKVNPLRPRLHCFVAEVHGEPIATGAISLCESVGLLCGASTVPERRRLGAQAALFRERLRFAHELGCHLAMVVAQPGSATQRNAERQGFRVAYTRT